MIFIDGFIKKKNLQKGGVPISILNVGPNKCSVSMLLEKLNYKTNLRKGKMKNQFRKIILVVAILVVLVINSFGQIDLGVKGGINVSYQLESGVSEIGRASYRERV